MRLKLVDFVVNTSMIDVDELVISSYIGLEQREEILYFYERLLSTCNDKVTLK